MSSAEQSERTILYLPASSVDWAGILTQFTLQIAATEGRLYATWAGERMSRATEVNDGIIALTPQGSLLGLMLFQVVDQSAELSFPWTKNADPDLAEILTEATLSALAEEYHDVRYIRIERQLLPGKIDPSGIEQAGFACHWRKRMLLDLAAQHESAQVPIGYHVLPWSVGYIDMAADVVYRANLGTLDAQLYAPFFGDSPAQCRKGLLAILAGRYGTVLQDATVCAFQGDTLVGINLVIDEEGGLASVVELSVDPQHQHRGLGRALLLQSISVLQQQAFERVELAVTNANTHAYHLYQSLGFTEFGSFPVCIPR
ncbi:MAG TPA: GNAT family N-acetyltransferase [Armatimonadota bacterium]|nr:GNAT family N-acetyltransferase [Armatimonadota bacterium]